MSVSYTDAVLMVLNLCMYYLDFCDCFSLDKIWSVMEKSLIISSYASKRVVLRHQNNSAHMRRDSKKDSRLDSSLRASVAIGSVCWILAK